MFTVFDLKDSTPLAPDELWAVRRVLDDYCRTAAGAWLRGFPHRRFELRWCPAITDDVLGAFTLLHPWTIYLKPPDTEATGRLRDYARISWAEIITPTVIHELRHAWQFRRNPLLYAVCCLPLLREVKAKYPGKTIWCFTGFRLDDELLADGSYPRCEATDEMLACIDVLVDGRFMKELKDISLQFRGSRNQRVIDMNRTRETGTVCIWDKLRR